MNDVEERLRAAFEARARTFESGPDAWQRVIERRPRGRIGRSGERARWARWAVAALPVALLAVFVPVLVNGGLGRNSAADPDEVYRQLMRDRTAAGAQTTVDDPSAGGSLRLWFARGRLGNPEFCYVVERDDAFGDCAGVEQPPGWSGWFQGSTLRDGAETAMDYGAGLPDVAAVSGLTKGGRTVAGTVLRPSGAPFLIWTVTYSPKDPLARVRFTDAAGRIVTDIRRDQLSPPADLGRPLGPVVDLPGGAVVGAYQGKDARVLRWTRAGDDIGRSTLDPAYLLKKAPVSVLSRGNLVFGVARSDVAEIRLAARTVTTVATRPDPWNAGVRLFSAPEPDGWDERHETVAYDAAGKEVWRDPWTPKNDLPVPPGDAMTVPGTEEFGHGPVRAWFSEEGGERVLCVSGGVDIDGTRQSGCDAPASDASTFSRSRLHTYLPEPGATLTYGVAPPDWEGIDAVLADGRRVPGSFLTSPGAPARMWYVVTPQVADPAAFAIRVKGGGPERVRLTRHPCWEVTTPGARAHALPEGVLATLEEGNCARFWRNGGQLPGAFETLPGDRLAATLAPERPLRWGRDHTLWYGYTLPGTAEVRVTLKDGRTATATTVSDPWDQGVLLFAGPIPDVSDDRGLSFTGYDAHGRELWTYEPEEADDF